MASQVIAEKRRREPGAPGVSYFSTLVKPDTNPTGSYS
jgi:hypothetical protein